MAYYLFNSVKVGAANRSTRRELAAQFLEVGMWGIDADEPHRDALQPDDLVLIYLGAPERVFIGSAELPRRSMIGHRRRHRCTRAIRLAECC